MSWTLYVTADADDVAEKLLAAKDAALDAQPFDSWDDDVEAQMLGAFKAVEQLAELVDEGHPLSINLNGHARRSDTDYAAVGVSISSPPPPAKKGK